MFLSCWTLELNWPARVIHNDDENQPSRKKIHRFGNLHEGSQKGSIEPYPLRTKQPLKIFFPPYIDDKGYSEPAWLKLPPELELNIAPCFSAGPRGDAKTFVSTAHTSSHLPIVKLRCREPHSKHRLRSPWNSAKNCLPHSLWMHQQWQQHGSLRFWVKTHIISTGTF